MLVTVWVSESQLPGLFIPPYLQSWLVPVMVWLSSRLHSCLGLKNSWHHFLPSPSTLDPGIMLAAHMKGEGPGQPVGPTKLVNLPKLVPLKAPFGIALGEAWLGFAGRFAYVRCLVREMIVAGRGSWSSQVLGYLRNSINGFFSVYCKLLRVFWIGPGYKSK